MLGDTASGVTVTAMSFSYTDADGNDVSEIAALMKAGDQLQMIRGTAEVPVYSIWELTFGAKSLLGKHKSGMRIGCGASKRPDVFTNNPVIDLEDAYNYLNENKRSAPVMSHS